MEGGKVCEHKGIDYMCTDVYDTISQYLLYRYCILLIMYDYGPCIDV